MALARVHYELISNNWGNPRFVEEENKHNKPQMPITKEEVEEMKAKFKELNERPIKKVAEAKARKKLRMMKKVEKMKQKAAKVATAEGMSEWQKIKTIRNMQVIPFPHPSFSSCAFLLPILTSLVTTPRKMRWARPEMLRQRRFTS